MAKKKPHKSKATPLPPVMPPAIAAPAEPVVEQQASPKEEPAKQRRHLSVGVWAYIIGILVALGAALFLEHGLDYLTYAVLAVLGIIVGLLNITEEEVLVFLVASVAFIVSASSVRLVLGEIPFVETFMNAIIIFTAASAFIVSIKALISTSRNT